MTSTHDLHPPAAGGPMANALAKNWWLLLLRGLVAIVLGVLTFVWPGVTLITLVVLYGAFALADGVLAVGASIIGGALAPRWWLLLIGLLGIAAGLVALLMPGTTTIVLLLCLAGWLIVTGLMQILGAVRLRKEIENEWLLIASGILAILFGAVLALQPVAGARALVYVVGICAMVYGILLVSFALRMRRLNRGAV